MGLQRIEVRHDDVVGVLLVAFSPVVRTGIRTILADDEGIKVVREVEDAAHALDEIRRAREAEQPIRVVLTETRTTKLDGAQVTRLIKDEFPGIAVLVLAENPNDSYVIDAIQDGADGYIFLTDTTPPALVNSVHRVIEGWTQIKTAPLRSAVEALIQNRRQTLAQNRRQTLAKLAAEAQLTEREADVLRLLGNGNSNKAIAEVLNVTLDTTKKHVHNVIKKLRARSRTHAAVIAAQAGA